MTPVTTSNASTPTSKTSSNPPTRRMRTTTWTRRDETTNTTTRTKTKRDETNKTPTRRSRRRSVRGASGAHATVARGADRAPRVDPGALTRADGGPGPEAARARRELVVAGLRPGVIGFWSVAHVAVSTRLPLFARTRSRANAVASAVEQQSA